MHGELGHGTLRAAEDLVRLRGGILDLARDAGLPARARAELLAAVSTSARRLLAAGGGAVDVRVEDGLLRIELLGSPEALSEVTGDGLERLVDRAELSPDGTALRLVKRLPPGGTVETEPLSGAVPQAGELLAEVAQQDAALLELLQEMERWSSEYERLNRELEDTNRGVMALYAELDERDRRKNEFLATLAHELRNPMSVIGTALHTLQLQATWEAGEAAGAGKQGGGGEGGGAAAGSRLVAVAERQLRHLARLVDDLLDVSRIDQGKINLRRETVDLAQVVERAVETCRPAFERRDHELTVTMTSEPLPLHADPTRIEQVIDNLLTNAAKYTPEGGRVELAARRQGGDAVLTVTDNGIGIPLEMQDKIFNLFAQADQSLDRSGGGLGLGLALVQRLVQMHGGTVIAESEGNDRGSRFTVRLPLAAPAEEPVSAAAGTAKAPGERAVAAGPLAVLIVEDNDDAREMLALLLEGRGYRVGTASDGHQGVEQIGQGDWDVAVVDIGLPGLDGYEVARRVRGDGHDLLLIALSGYGRPEDQDKSAQAGFDRHLVKPVEPEALFNLLDQAGRRD
ncbi:MAG TPA: ATP-binding protein [Thermoanaerobaculia bacterium]|nr:ATP-binding protein [Thermoanaerobaculia bacterium]